VGGGTHATVLVLDDDESLRFLCRVNLELDGYRVLEGASLAEASAGASYGFFFSSVSATPYLPFDRWMEGVEKNFPDGWETDKPPDHQIGGRDFADLPGKHLVYYQRAENYGALGFYELDPALEWEGAGARQFYAQAQLSASQLSSKMAIETALAFLANAKRIAGDVTTAIDIFDPVPAAMVRLAGRERGR